MNCPLCGKSTKPASMSLDFPVCECGWSEWIDCLACGTMLGMEWKRGKYICSRCGSTLTKGNDMSKEMTVSEAGRIGGAKTKEKYGSAYYSEIGRKGGIAVSELMGPEFYKRIGKMGGDTIAASRGKEFFVEIGKKGGAAVIEKYGPDYFSNIGKMGGKKRRGRSSRKAVSA